jgi:hypothetical protein
VRGEGEERNRKKKKMSENVVLYVCVHAIECIVINGIITTKLQRII